MATDDFDEETGLPFRVQNRKPGLSFANELFQQSGNRRMKVNLAKGALQFSAVVRPCRDEPSGGSEMVEKVGRDVLVNFDTKRLPDPQYQPHRTE